LYIGATKQPKQGDSRYKTITEIIGGVQGLLSISYHVQDIFEEYLTDEYKTFLHHYNHGIHKAAKNRFNAQTVVRF
jgi:hypothetical protein